MRKKISVCIATYNGEKYIKEQLNSILTQLKKDDEIIISDDGSTDKTVEIIKTYVDPRMKFFLNTNGKGPIKNFENAIGKAVGDFIFLSDQDDLWNNTKVEEILTAFSSDEDLTMIFSNADIIDEDGVSKGYSFFKDNNANDKSIIKSFFKNQFLGCTIAFKSELRSKILPFPSKIPMHDWWIGILNLHYGKVLFLNKNLISYRRHNNNVTSESSSNLSKIVSWRNTLFWLFLKRILKNS